MYLQQVGRGLRPHLDEYIRKHLDPAFKSVFNIIDKGSLLYDGSLQEIRNKYGTTRQLIAEFNEDTEVTPIENVMIGDPKDRKRSFTFDNSVVDVNALMHEILGKYSIRDITVTEPEIETIIRKIYNKEVFA